MYTDLQNKIAVVTGASKGLGTAIAERFGQEGMDVVVAYHSDREGAEEAADCIRGYGRKAVILQGDIGTEQGSEDLLRAATDAFGRVDVWVNNAGMENQVATHDMPLADWQRVMDVNLTGVFLGTRCALRHFLGRSAAGVIINMSSVHEIIPWPTFAHYAASKGGVGMFTRSVAMEYAARNIRVNAIGPGAINTPINAEKFADPTKKADTEAMIPMKRIGKPEEVAAAAAWLASEEASYVTGVTLYVDGGMVLYPSFQEGKG